jgi:hypothetical protein
MISFWKKTIKSYGHFLHQFIRSLSAGFIFFIPYNVALIQYKSFFIFSKENFNFAAEFPEKDQMLFISI